MRGRFFQGLYLKAVLPVLRSIPFTSLAIGPVRRFCPTFQSWIGGNRSKINDATQSICCVIGPKRIEESPPVLALPRLPQRILEEQIHQSPGAFLATMRWGRVATRYSEVITPDDTIVGDLFFPPVGRYGRASSMIRPFLPRAAERRGNYAVVFNSRGLVNYYHWLINCLPRLWVLESCGIANYKLIVPRRQLSFQSQSLEVLNLTGEKVALIGDEHWRVEHLLVPSYPMASRHVSAEGCRWLRDKILAACGGRVEAADLPRKLYISRRKASVRRLENEPEIEALLRTHNFTTIISEDLAFAEQVSLFANADVVVAPHGAGLANILFMPEGKLLLELLPSKRVKPHFCNLASAMKIRYACITDATDVDQIAIDDANAPEADFQIPLTRLATALDRLGI